MNRTMLCAALLTISCSATYADDAPKPVPTAPEATTTIQVPNPATTEPATPTTLQTSTQPVKGASVPAPNTAPVIDCQYRLPANSTVDQSILKTWVEKATVQSFDFSPATIDDQLIKLKPCFTDQGWQSFNDALQKSGNISTIKSHKLTVSSQVNGDLTINSTKDNQWKVTVPLQVVYQNDKEKLTQLLMVDLLVGRKMSGDLGIFQIIATPRPAGGTAKPTDGAAKSPAAPNDLAPSAEPKPAAATE